MSNISARALPLLGDGISPEQVASALGVTPSAISQLLSDAEFAEQVTTLRYKNLAAHTARDKELDSFEDSLIRKLKSTAEMLYDPMKIVRVFQVINAAKRRGAANPETFTQTNQPVLQLNIPVLLIDKFQTVNNVYNQVLEIKNDHDGSSKSLVTIQSNAIAKLLPSPGTE